MKLLCEIGCIIRTNLNFEVADISVGAGHKDPRFMWKIYVPVLNSRVQWLNETRDGRFGGWPDAPPQAQPQTRGRASRRTG